MKFPKILLLIFLTALSLPVLSWAEPQVGTSENSDLLRVSPDFLLKGPGESKRDETKFIRSSKENIDQIMQANNHYLNSQYDEAAQIYEDLLSQGNHNAFLYYNLGNTYIRQSRLGKAILNYLKARQLLPRDQNLDANLNYAIAETVDRLQVPDVEGLSKLFFWLNDLTLAELVKSLVIINLLFWTLLTFWSIKNGKNLDLARKITLVILLFALGSTVAKSKMQSDVILGVIQPEKVAVQSESGTGKVVLFELHEGAIVTLKNRNQGWVQIVVAENKMGWVPEKVVLPALLDS